MNNAGIKTVLRALGETVPPGSEIILLGGSALALLGNIRPTADIDFIGDDRHPSELHKLLFKKAAELKVFVEAVPLDQFIPLPDASESRKIPVGEFGNLHVSIADPYAIALSKVERGFDTDFEDVIFLINQRYVSFDSLEKYVLGASEKAREFDIDPQELLAHLQELKKRKQRVSK